MSVTNDKVYLIARGGRLVLAMLGLALALFGSRAVQPTAEDGDVLVWVNQRPVTTKQLAFAEERLTRGSPERLSAMQRQSIIQLLIDEELLLQRAESLGTFGVDQGVRKAIVQAVIDEVVDDFLAQAVGDQQLKQFYMNHRAVFERPARVAIEALRFDNLRDASQAHTAILGGTDFRKIGRAAHAKVINHLPSAPLPAHMLRRYLGTSLTDIALTLERDEVSDPIIRPDGVFLLRANAVNPASVPELEDVLAEVKTEYQVRGRDIALEKAIAELWRGAEIDFNKEVVDDLAVAGKYRPGLFQLSRIVTQPRGGS